MNLSSLWKRRGTTLAGIFSLALGSLALLCGAGSVPMENPLPQGVLQGDFNFGGHNLTNAATVSATNVVVSGSFTAPAGFTLPFAKLSATPTSLSGYGITDPVVLSSGSYANPSWLTSLAYSKLTGAPALGSAGDQAAFGFVTSTGPVGQVLAAMGDSRFAGPQGTSTTVYTAPYAWLDRVPMQLNTRGYYQNGFVCNSAVAGTGIAAALAWYAGNSFTTTGNITAGSNTVNVTGSTSGITGTFGIGGPGIPPGTRATISGSTITLKSVYGITNGGGGIIAPAGLTPATTTAGATLDIYLPIAANNEASPQTPHEVSPAVTGISGGHFIYGGGINDVQGPTTTTASLTNGSPTFTTAFWTGPFLYPGMTISAGSFSSTIASSTFSAGTTTVTMGNAYTGTTGSAAVTIGPTSAGMLAGFTTLKNLALADNYTVFVCTVPKAWIGGWFSNDSIRTAYNSALLSTYGVNSLGNGIYTSGANPNVYVIDSASMSIWGSNNSLYYADGLHPTALASTLWADEINTAISTAMGATGPGNVLGAFQSIPTTALQPYYQLQVDPTGLGGYISLGGNDSNHLYNLYLGNLQIQNNGGTCFIYDPLSVAGGLSATSSANASTTFDFNSSGAGTFINGPFAQASNLSTSGRYAVYIGKGASNNNCGWVTFDYTGAGSAANSIGLTLYNSPALASLNVSATSVSVNAAPLNINTVQTTVSGSASGTAVFAEPLAGTAYKRVVVNCNALTGSATYVFPTAFTNAPVVMTTSGPAASTVTSLSASAVTVTGSSTTGLLILEGY